MSNLSSSAHDWPLVELNAVATIQTGLAKGKRNLNKPVSLPYLRVANVQDGFLDLAHIKQIEVCSSEVERYRLRHGDVLLTEGGDADKLGRGHVWHGQIDPCLHQNHIFAVRTDRKRLDPKFLNLYISSTHGKLYFLRCAKQTTNLATINTSQLRQMPVPIPPLPEQRRIVEILDEADAAVRTTEALIAANLKYKRAWAERLLTGKVRFPEFAEQTWHTASLGEFFRDRNARYSRDEPPIVLSCSKIHGIVPQTDLFSRILASKDLGRYKLVEPGDLVFDPMLLWDASINFSTRRGVVSPAYSTLQFVAAHAEPRFFHYLFDTHALRHVYKTISQGTNTRRKKATAADFLKIRVRLPGHREQQRIAEVLSLMDAEIALRRRQLAALKAQKQGLMQKLLTGEVRVKEFAP